MDFQEVLRTVARKNNTTPEEVYIEMKKAIDEAWAHRTPEVIAVHQKMGFGDKAPTVEEFIRKMSYDVRKEMNSEKPC